MVEEQQSDTAWQTRWWAEDFTWDGLAGKSWLGWSVTPDARITETDDAPADARPATLQDYFRRDPASRALRDDAALLASGLLVETPGQPAFHILHLPVRWQDGSPSWKSDPEAREWARLEAEIAGWLDAARETHFDGWRPLGADRRARLDGGVIRALLHANDSGASALHLRARHVCVLGDLDLADADFGSDADFTSARFAGPAGFAAAKFGAHAQFEKALFNGEAHFTAAKFNGNAGFAGTAFASDARFDKADIKGYADFEDARFSAKASFHSTTVHDLADFLGARIDGDADFRAANFIGELDFGADCRAGASFQGARFKARTDFRGAHFHGETGFKGAVFGG